MGATARTGMAVVATLGGAFGQPTPGLAMLAGAYGMQRSLGSWPALWLATAVAAVNPGVEAVLVGQPDWAAAAGSMALPLALFLLARRQLVPGLRRGRMTDAERQRWILRHALAPADRTGPWGFAAGEVRTLPR